MSGRPNASGMAQLLIVNVFLMISSGSLLGGRCIAPGLPQTCQFNLGCRHITTVTTSGRRTVTGSDMSIQFDPKLPPAILHSLTSCCSAPLETTHTLYASICFMFIQVCMSQKIKSTGTSARCNRVTGIVSKC